QADDSRGGEKQAEEDRSDGSGAPEHAGLDAVRVQRLLETAAVLEGVDGEVVHSAALGRRLEELAPRHPQEVVAMFPWARDEVGRGGAGRRRMLDRVPAT